MNQQIINYISEILPEKNIMFNEDMSRHVSFRTGGEAACFLEIENATQLGKLVALLCKAEREFFVLGNGSNLLVGDKGYKGIVIHLGKLYSKIRVSGNKIYAQSGALLSQIAREAQKAGLTGMEFAAGIPGSVGGAVVMNAGAYGGEMKQIVKTVIVFSQNGEELSLDNETMEFGYRTSVLKKHPLVVSEVEIELQEGDKDQIEQTMKELAQKRREKQPLEYPSAGSTFKRPEGYFAGKLIMDSGLRGLRVGGAQVSEKHCGFIINRGNATSEDILELMDEVRFRVKQRFGVILEPEVIQIGEF